MANYKEKYETIIAKLKEARNDSLKQDDRFCVIIDEIVPDLEETEEEKIKKRIIQAIRFREEHMDENWSDEIAWFEKQGEQKPMEWSDRDQEHISRILNYLDFCRSHRRPSEPIQKEMRWLESLLKKYTRN